MNPTFRWIESTAWELDFFGLPHRIPWPENVDPAIANNTPFELEHMLDAIDAMGAEAGEPWTSFAKAAEHFEELTEALQDSELADAAELIEKVEAAHPDTSFVLFHKAYLARGRGELDEAVAFYRAAGEKTPGIAQIWNNLAMILAMQERRDDAVDAFRKALAASPQDRTALEGLAQLRELVKLIRDPKDEKSAMYVEIPVFRDMATKQLGALASDPDQLLNYGEELFRTGIIPDVGITALEKAREIRPTHPRTLYALATVYRANGRLEDAKKMSEELAAAVPDNADAHFNLAQSCNALGDTAGERAALERVLELNPNQQAALGIWFGLKPSDHDPEKETQLVKFGEERNSWMAFILASALCRERGDFPRAVKRAERAVEMAPESEEALLHFTAMLGDAKEMQKLATAVKPKVESGKFSKRLDWNYAHVLRQLGLTQDAIAVLRKASSGEVPDDFKNACHTTLEAWTGMLTGAGVQLEVHPNGFLLRDVLLTVDGEDGGLILNAGVPLPLGKAFPWRASGAETSVFLQQGESDAGKEPRALGEFRVRGIELAANGPTTIECHVTALPDGALHFRAAQNGKRLQVGWGPPRGNR